MKRVVGLLTLALTIGFAVGLALIPSASIVEYVGTDNIYLFMFLIALIGSLSTFASIPYPLILISLVSAGGSPLILGLASAMGVIISDTLMFFSVKRGKAIMSESLQASITYVGTVFTKYPALVMPGLFVYGTVSPLSNDFAVTVFSLMNYSVLRVLVPLALGNIVYNLTLAYYGSALISRIVTLLPWW